MKSALLNKNVWLLILAIILLRLPSLDRPLSKHHEFNSAVTLINAESWQQAGGGSVFSFTPLMNYQGPSNRLLEKGWHLDKGNNHLYLSYGAGAFALPYFVLKGMHLPFTPLWLQWLNILVSIITVVLLFRLLHAITNNKQIAFASVVLFAVLPAPLWYGGNGYVNVAVMLPLVILILQTWHQFETSKSSIGFLQVMQLFLLTVALMYFDWFAVFLVGMMALWALVQARKNAAFIWVAFTAAAGILIGIFIVLLQYANYLGWDQVLHYWRSRFLERSANTSEFSFGMMVLMIARNLLTGYLPLLCLLVVFLVKRKLFKQNFVKWPCWAFVAIIPYNGLFFNWSAEHEFAWLAFALAGVILVGVYVLPHFNTLWLKRIVGLYVILSLSIYFVINRPGTLSWKGEKYAAQKELGEWIRNHADTSLPLFTNLNNDKITEFYSKRILNTTTDISAALKICKQFDIKKGLWLQIEKNKVQKLIYIQ